MNGRVYDPVLGRFLSADPYVGDAYDSQDYNRYSYLGNNPLGGTDPSGYFSLKDAGMIVAAVIVGVVTAGVALYAYAAMVGATFTGGLVGAISSVGLAAGWGGGWAVAAGAGFGFGSSFAASLLNGGSIGDAFKAGVIGGVVGGISAYGAGKIGDFAEANGWFRGAGQNLAHGALQGGFTEATGGEFRHGFYAGFFSSAAAGPIQGAFPDRLAAQTAAVAIVGGTASAVGGGKFANGAVSGAFTYLFNHAGDHSGMSKSERQSAIRRARTLWKAGGAYETINELWVPTGEDHNSWGSTGRRWVALLKQSLGVELVKPMDSDSMTVVQVESLVAEYTFETTVHYKVFDTGTEKFLRYETQVEDRYVYRTFRTSTLPLPPEGITWTNPKNYAVPAWKGEPVPWREWRKDHRY